MGSPEAEAGIDHRLERPGWQTPRPFSIATTEVTVSLFGRFRAGRPQDEGQEPDRPVHDVSFYDAARFCNWLSEREGIPKDQWCYPASEDEIKKNLLLPPDVLLQTGYRLPTAAEWEYACRAGSTTRRFHGSSQEMLSYYAWTGANSGWQARPVGRLKPNDFGLFDVLGNVAEWAHPVRPLIVSPNCPVKDTTRTLYGILRGRSYQSGPQYVRAAGCDFMSPEVPLDTVGFRVARTHR
jgi:formylglycine-generating enzyme required for sulfatase activity